MHPKQWTQCYGWWIDECSRPEFQVGVKLTFTNIMTMIDQQFMKFWSMWYHISDKNKLIIWNETMFFRTLCVWSVLNLFANMISINEDTIFDCFNSSYDCCTISAYTKWCSADGVPRYFKNSSWNCSHSSLDNICHLASSLWQLFQYFWSLSLLVLHMISTIEFFTGKPFQIWKAVK